MVVSKKEGVQKIKAASRIRGRNGYYHLFLNYEDGENMANINSLFNGH